MDTDNFDRFWESIFFGGGGWYVLFPLVGGWGWRRRDGVWRVTVHGRSTSARWGLPAITPGVGVQISYEFMDTKSHPACCKRIKDDLMKYPMVYSK